MIVRRGDVTDPLILNVRLEPAFMAEEERKLSVRISTSESRKLLVKEFLIKAHSHQPKVYKEDNQPKT